MARVARPPSSRFGPSAEPSDASIDGADASGPQGEPASTGDLATPTVFAARRPAVLVVPFAILTETAGVLFVLHGIPIGWAVVAAPLGALLFTTLLFRPTLELTREGVLQRQRPFSSLTPWEAIEDVVLTRAGNRLIVAYRVRAGFPKPRRQPAASLLRAAGQPYDGGWFADSLAAPPEVVLEAVREYLADPGRRLRLPAARR